MRPKGITSLVLNRKDQDFAYCRIIQGGHTDDRYWSSRTLSCRSEIFFCKITSILKGQRPPSHLNLRCTVQDFKELFRNLFFISSLRSKFQWKPKPKHLWARHLFRQSGKNLGTRIAPGFGPQKTELERFVFSTIDSEFKHSADWSGPQIGSVVDR
jgi:hypothetical protein